MPPSPSSSPTPPTTPTPSTPKSPERCFSATTTSPSTPTASATLEKAPLLYWSMAASMRVAQLVGATSPRALTAAARIPLSLTVLALALLIEAFGRRLFHSTRAGLYAALITLSSFGIFLFTRINLPDAMVCLFTTLALYCFCAPKSSTPQPQSQPQIRCPMSRL